MSSPDHTEEHSKYSKTPQSDGNVGNSGMEFDEEIVHGMTASYTEISFNTQSSEPDDSVLEDLNETVHEFGPSGSAEAEDQGDLKDRPNKLSLHKEESQTNPLTNKAVEYLNRLDGTITQDGAMVSFVAQDLESKIKLSSPVSTDVNLWNNGMPWIYRHTLTGTTPSAIDPEILSNLEAEVGKIATSVDSITENLAGILHSMSALTVDCLETYRDVVCKTCDAVDQNIKSMYQLMAKCEELGKSMKPIYKLAEHIKEMKHFLEMFENTLS